jgi:4-amino-4-deoxy-L-arabinose transferase-like glycosyltransferase
MLAAIGWTGRLLYGPRTGLAALALGALSPFILFQAGSFLSHPIAGALLAGALAAFMTGERSGGQVRWYALAGALLGAAGLTREAASVLFATPLVVWLVQYRRWRPLGRLVAAGLPFVALYVVYNTALTGSPLILPRNLFDPTDRFGFGDGMGFHQRHTLAAGLANADELLTLLQLDLFGWPPLFTLGLLGVPLLLGRADRRDRLLVGGFLLFVAAYVGYFYHGNALGPRYYYEALPFMLLLAARGLQVAAHSAVRLGSSVFAARAGVLASVALLSLNTGLFYLPREVARRSDFAALPGAQPLALAFVQASTLGPRLTNVPTPALVLVNDWWLYNAVVAPLNCPDMDAEALPRCPVIFALAQSATGARDLRGQYPGRTVLRAVAVHNTLDLVPDPG